MADLGRAFIDAAMDGQLEAVRTLLGQECVCVSRRGPRGAGRLSEALRGESEEGDRLFEDAVRLSGDGAGVPSTSRKRLERSRRRSGAALIRFVDKSLLDATQRAHSACVNGILTCALRAAASACSRAATTSRSNKLRFSSTNARICAAWWRRTSSSRLSPSLAHTPSDCPTSARRRNHATLCTLVFLARRKPSPASFTFWSNTVRSR